MGKGKCVNTIEQLRRRKYNIRREIADCEDYFEDSYESFMEPVSTITEAFKGNKSARQEILSAYLTPDTFMRVATGVFGIIRFFKGLAHKRKNKNKKSRGLRNRHR